jgi:hypothetical protein
MSQAKISRIEKGVVGVVPMEVRAFELRVFQPTVLPGFLQTCGYAGGGVPPRSGQQQCPCAARVR